MVTINVTSMSGINGGVVFGNSALYDHWPVNGSAMQIHNKTGKIGVDGDRTMYIATNGGFASPHNFTTGDSINGTWSIWENDEAYSAFHNIQGTSPDFGPGSYLGFRYGAGTNWNYGWIHVLWNSTNSEFQILGGAYETDLNTTINAGWTGGTTGGGTTGGGGAVPEPGEWAAIGILGAGLAGLVIRKRRTA